jgi:glycerol-3-phosphate O-acyltransferase
VASSVTIPLWLALLAGALAVVALIDRLFAPALGWWMRRRVNRAIDELNQRLKLKIPPFKLARRRQLIEQLMFDPEVLKAVEDEAKADEPRASPMRAPALRQRSSPSAYTWSGRGSPVAVDRVRVGAFDEATLYQVPDDASVVFVINHRSNMDYVLVTYLVSENSALSYAVGEWAQVWMLQSLIRAMGGYFVRRDSSNALYRKLLSSYVQMATSSGVAQAVFPEGGLTRDGARPPGLLSYMVSGFPGPRDIVFVPVGINDRVLEDRSAGLRGQRRRFAFNPSPWAWPMARLRGWLLRYACVSFGRPLSLRAMADADRRARAPGGRFPESSSWGSG